METATEQELECIQPVYVRKFQCDGSLCNAMCCKNWEIRLDERTCEAYRKLRPEEWRQRILQSITWNEEAGCHVIRPRAEDKGCPMLREDQLCSIQRQFGLDALSDVCAEYPRKTWQLPGLLERALCMTCPVVAETIFAEEAPLRFEQIMLSDRRKTYFLQADDEERIREISFFDLQWTGIAILQDRSRHLPERLWLLEQFLSEVDELMASGRGEEIPSLAEKYREGRYPSGYRTGDTKEERCFDWDMLKYLTEKLEDDAAETRNCLALGRKVFGEWAGKFLPREEQLYQEYMSNHEVKLEHYLVNEYFMELYPCAFPGTFFLNGRMLEALFRLIALQLFLLAASGKAPEEQDFLDSIRWMSVRTNHYVDYTIEMMRYLCKTDGVPS